MLSFQINSFFSIIRIYSFQDHKRLLQANRNQPLPDNCNDGYNILDCQKLGDKLRNHNIVAKLRQEMTHDNERVNKSDNSVHYYGIDSCSGSAKSLLCFSLNNEDLKVVLLVLNAGGEKQQAIHKSLTKDA